MLLDTAKFVHSISARHPLPAVFSAVTTPVDSYIPNPAEREYEVKAWHWQHLWIGWIGVISFFVSSRGQSMYTEQGAILTVEEK
jgi:hypothetical protein